MRTEIWRIGLPLVLLAALLPWQARPAAMAVHATSPKLDTPHLVSGFGHLPLSFEPNVGQSDPRVRFLARGGGYTLFLTDSGPVMSLTIPSGARATDLPAVSTPLLPRMSTSAGLAALPSHLLTHAAPRASAPAVVTLHLVGANPRPRLVGEDKLPGIVNYFIGNVPSHWHTHIPTYAQVRYQNVYPGIDLVYYGGQGGLEYDFVVRPGTDAGRIRLVVSAELDGKALPAVLDKQGNLVVKLPGGTLVQRAPVVYQGQGARRVPVAGRFTLSNGQLGLRLGAYDRALPLVVDPTLVYSTYLGGSRGDVGRGIAVDGRGDAYVTGDAMSSNFTLNRPFQPRYGGGYTDAFVAALSGDGRTLRYSSYLGGGGEDFGNGIAVDGQGHAYVTGYTMSSNFPLSHPFQGRYADEPGISTSDAFVTALSVDGGALRYSTYLGSSGNSAGYGIAVDRQGNAYVTGKTDSPTFPLSHPFQARYGGKNDAFVTVFNANGRALRYSTYLGGSADDEGLGIAVDGHGNAYVTGNTASSNFPLSHPFQARYGGGYFGDAFVAALSTNGQALRYSSYLGGGGDDIGIGIAMDGHGIAYVTGNTTSSNFPLSHPFQTGNGGKVDAFVAALSADGRALRYSTYLGGGGNDAGYGIAADRQGNAYVTGITTSSNFPLSHPIQAHYGGGDYGAFVAAMSRDGQTLRFGTYFGGSEGDEGHGIAVDRSGNAYLTGITFSSNFPLSHPIQAHNGGNSDLFVAKISSQ
jgi:Beta-propeller repeat